jgi:hypothetical protein
MKHGRFHARRGSSRSNPGVRTFLVAGAALAALTIDPAEASAFDWGWYTNERPGLACRTEDPTMITHWATILNTDSMNAHTVWCPLDAPNAATPSNVHIYVTQGWITLTSCTYAALVDLNVGWWYSPDSITPNYNNQTDSLGFSIPYDQTILGNEVECSVPPGQYVMAYDERLQVVFAGGQSW